MPARDGAAGTIASRNLLADYADYLRKLVDLSGIRPLKVAVDAGNGMAGYTVPAVFAGLPLETVPLYFELDGSFPNHEANPIDPANLRDLQHAVISSGADIGLAFDGDADRCFVVDERGEIVSPSVLTALIAVRELAREPGATVIHNLITSRAVPEIVTEHGGVPVRTRVGHSFIKAEMAATGAIFGGEHSGHFYFRDFWFADSGMLAALHVLAALGAQDGPLSVLLAEYSRYTASGEINSEVSDQAAVAAQVREAFAGRPGVTIDELDGLTVTGPGWWFNLRPSNTEPLLRLNVEAPMRRSWPPSATRCCAWCAAIPPARPDTCPPCPSPRHHGRRREDRRLAAGDPGLPEVPRAAAGRRRGQRAGLHRCGVRPRVPGARRHPRAAGGRGAPPAGWLNAGRGSPGRRRPG